jgi:hypothetical protein
MIMGYSTGDYRGKLGQVSPPMPAPETLGLPATTDGFIDVIRSLSPPEDAAGPEDFSKILQHDRLPIVVEHLGEEHRWLGTGKPFGVAAAHNVARRRRPLLKKGLVPGIYTITKTVFVEQTEGADQSGLAAKVQENFRPLIPLGRPGGTTEVRPATEEEVVQAIDTVFMAAAGITTEYVPSNSPDNPASVAVVPPL